MSQFKYLYTFNYDYHNSDLCKLEARQIFKQEMNEKVLFSDLKIDPSISPFIKTRIELITFSDNYAQFINNIQEKDIHQVGFKIEYLTLLGDTTDFAERRVKMRDVGFKITGEPDFTSPFITYAICVYNGVWYFGELTKHNMEWQKHKKKPQSFSNSINMDIAKSLVALASQGNKKNTLLDACCGVGTIMLEACIAGFNIEGCDIDPKRCEFTQKNLGNYGYSAEVHCSDIKDLNQNFDVALVDLPYNLYSYSNDTIITNIIESASKKAPRVIIVSTSDIENTLKRSGLLTQDSCIVEKRGKTNFSRKIWVCERD